MRDQKVQLIAIYYEINLQIIYKNSVFISLQMKSINMKIEKLEQMMVRKVKEDGLSEYERAKRDVKEEAQKTQVNIDIYMRC